MGLLEAWAQQHEKCKLGRSAMLISTQAAHGSICIFGDREGDCAVIFVDSSNRATPICTGSYQTCRRLALALKRGQTEVPTHPRPAVWIGGVKRSFTLLPGHTVFGAVEVGATTVLLGFIGDRCALALYEPGRMEWIHVGPADGLGTVDVDLWRTMHPRPEPLPEKPRPRDQRDVQLDQLRRQVVDGEVEEHEGPSPGKAVVTCMEALVDRAPEGPRRQRVRWVVDLFVQLARHGLRKNLVGTSGRMASRISRILEVPVPPKDLAAAFLELVRMDCCLVSCTDRTWTAHLHEVLDRRSSLHRRFLAETGSCSRLTSRDLLRRVQEPVSATAANDGATRERRAAAEPGSEVERPGEGTVVEHETSVVSGLCILGLLTLALEQWADERDKARVSHIALKEAMAQHAAEREQWASAQAAHEQEVATLRAELATREREGVDLRAELAAREGALEAVRGQLKAAQVMTGETFAGLREEIRHFVSVASAEAVRADAVERQVDQLKAEIAALAAERQPADPDVSHDRACGSRS